MRHVPKQSSNSPQNHHFRGFGSSGPSQQGNQAKFQQLFDNVVAEEDVIAEVDVIAEK
jgi:hypothetical protein